LNPGVWGQPGQYSQTLLRKGERKDKIERRKKGRKEGRVNQRKKE
jgi:hypothetical protein